MFRTSIFALAVTSVALVCTPTTAEAQVRPFGSYVNGVYVPPGAVAAPYFAPNPYIANQPAFNVVGVNGFVQNPFNPFFFNPVPVTSQLAATNSAFSPYRNFVFPGSNFTWGGLGVDAWGRPVTTQTFGWRTMNGGWHGYTIQNNYNPWGGPNTSLFIR